MVKLVQNRVYDTKEILSLHNECVTMLDTAAQCCVEWDDALVQVKSLYGQSVAKSNQLTNILASAPNPLIPVDVERERTLISVTLENMINCIPLQDQVSAAALNCVSANIAETTKVMDSLKEYISVERMSVGAFDYRTSFLKLLGSESVTKIDENRKACETLLLGMPEYTSYAADPVNMNTGNFVYVYKDLETKGAEPFCFIRTYNGMSKHKGTLGRGWFHNFEKAIKKQEETLILYHEDGREENFNFLETEGYTSKKSNIVIKETKTGYLLNNPDKVLEIYDKDGRLLKQVEGEYNETLLTYENKRLIKVSKRGKESFLFSYDESDRLISITDHTGRTVTYGYTGKKLTSVTDPEGKCFTYDYEQNGRISKITDKRGVSIVENEYDEYRRITKQMFPDGGEVTLTYKDRENKVELTQQNGSKVTYIHDEEFRDKKICYEDGYEEWTYDKNGYVSSYRDKNGNETCYQNDKRGNVTGETDALGQKKQTIYNESDKPLMIIYPDESKELFSYDERGRLIGIRNRMQNEISLYYEEEGTRPALILLADHSAIHMSYDEKGNIIKAEYPDGTGYVYTYDGLGRVIESTDKAGRSVKFSYDKVNRLTETERPDGKKQEITYNEMGEAVKIKDFDGHEMTWEYNELNKPSKYLDKLGRQTSMEYDLMWNLSRVTDPEGGSTGYEYDGLSRLTAVTDPLGRKVKFFYDPKGNRTKVEFPDGSKHCYEYDALDRKIRETDRAGRETRTTYDCMGNITCVTDNAGNKTLYMYDKAGRKVKEINREGAQTCYTYTPLDKKENVTYPDGSVERYHYAPGGRLIRLEKRDGSWESYDHDKAGNLIQCIHSDGREYTYTYDCLDRMTEIAVNGVTQKRYSYDAMGNVTAMEDAAGNVTTYDYSLMGKLLRVTDVLGNSVQYCYNGRDELIGILQLEKNEELTFLETKDGAETLFTDEDWNKVITHNRENKDLHLTVFERDKAGQVTCITDAMGGKDTYTYDVMGRVMERTTPNGDVITRSYHPDGQVKEIIYPNGKKVAYTYDSLARLQQLKDWMGETIFSYDREGNLLKTKDHAGEVITYKRNAFGTLQKLCYPDGTEVSYGYDSTGKLSKIESKEFQMSYGYDIGGNVSHMDRGNGIHTSYAYNSLGQPINLTHEDKDGILETFKCEYDILGNKTKVERQSRDTNYSCISSYSYDALNRLVKTEENGQVVSEYQYDGYGNRILQTEYKQGDSFLQEPIVKQFTYNSKNQVIGCEEVTHICDANGFLTNLSRDGKLLQESLYNGLGCRVESILYEEEKENISYVPDYAEAYRRVLTQKDKSGKYQNYLWQDNTLLGLPKEEGYVLTDLFHTPIRVTDKEGNTESIYQYDAFGNLQKKQEQMPIPFGYSGYLKEETDNLYYAGSRSYDAKTGRFVSKDLYRYMDYKEPASINLYSFVQGNPLRYVDFDGHKSIEEKSYMDRTVEHVVMGEYSDEVTALGIGIDVAAGVIGVDVAMDVRDLSAHLTVNRDLDSWEWWGMLAINLIAFVPVVGSVKYLAKGAKVAKHVDEAGAIVKNSNLVLELQGYVDEASVATAEIMKTVDSEVFSSTKDIIKGVECGDIPLLNSIQKGNYGEMKMDIHFENQGYQRISLDKVNGLNDSTHHGIDGVYFNPNGHPPYVIGEAKYGSSRLSMTRDGLQMGDDWINGSNRLVNSVGKELADDILLAGYGKQLVRISPDGTVTVTILNNVDK